MTTQPPTLTDFLLARIAEDEAVAREAMVGEYGPRADDSGQWRMIETDHEGIWPEEPAESYGYGYVSDESWAVHAERHDPARVLAECDAKRRIVKRYLDTKRLRDEGDATEYAAEWIGLETALEILSNTYADHPEWREEWRP